MGIVIGILIVACLLVIGVRNYGLAFPRFGRWLDARIYARFPRAGHLFINEREADDAARDAKQDRYDPFDAGRS